jgi:hypothetical protein
VEDLIYTLFELLAPLLLAAVTWAAGALAKLITAKVGNEWLKAALVRLDEAVATAVRELASSLPRGHGRLELGALAAPGKLAATLDAAAHLSRGPALFGRAWAGGVRSAGRWDLDAGAIGGLRLEW